MKGFKVLGALLWLCGGGAAGASERLAVEVLSALGEPLLATLTLPLDAPSSPLGLELQGSSSSLVAEADGTTPGRIVLRSDGAMDAPIVQGVLRVGPGADAQRYRFTLFLDAPTSPAALTVSPGATLWRLAKQWAGPPGSTRAQRVAALFYRNPQAFLAGDPNRLLAGVELQLPSAKAVFEGPGLPSAPRLEVRPPGPGSAPADPNPLLAELQEERAALAAALARAEADRRAWEAAREAQAAQLAALTAQLERQQRALEAMQQTPEITIAAHGPSEGYLGLLVGAALAGLAGLAGLGSLLHRRRAGPSEQAAPAPVSPAAASEGVSEAVPEAVPQANAPLGPGLRVYEPSALVQRFGAQSLLSQRDWRPVLDQVEIALAYGRLEEAEAALGAALEEDPHSVALRLQSLALAVERGDRSRFEHEAVSLARGADATLAAKLEELAERLPPPSRGPATPAVSASYVLETPGPVPTAEPSPSSLGVGLSLALEEEGSRG